jgi:LysM repeat protein
MLRKKIALEGQGFYFQAMKRFLLILMAAVSFGGWAWAQDAAAVAANAEQEYTKEQIKRLNATVEELLAAQLAMQKRLATLIEEMEGLREELALAKKNAANAASLEDLKRLAQNVQELDHRREADKKQILEALQKLAAKAPQVSREPTNPPARAPTHKEKGYEYEVQDGDTLSTIVAEYRKQGVKVTVEQVLKANPNLKPNRLIVGKKIFIPDAALKP